MNKSFIKGLFAGVLVPLVFLGTICYWIHRFTDKVPFPIDRPQEGQLTFALVDPKEVPSLWSRWQAELDPLIKRAVSAIYTARARVLALIGGSSQS